MKCMRVLLVAAVFGMATPAASRAEEWPSKPVRMVVGFAPGSATDIVARLVAEELQAAFKQTFYVEDKPGASGIIGSDAVAKAKADGYTLLVTTATAQAINPYLFKKLPYDPLKDFSAVARICSLPYVLAVDAKLPIHTMQEFLEWARKPGNPVSYAYANGPGQMAGAMLVTQGGFESTALSYKSGPQAMSDVAAGQVSFMFTDLASSQAFIQSGRLRALAVASDGRSALMPELPTIFEASGLRGFDLVTWIGVLGPAGLPPEITEKLNRAVNASLKKREVLDKLVRLGADAAPATVAEMETYLAQQLEVWGKRAHSAGIEPQ